MKKVILAAALLSACSPMSSAYRPATVPDTASEPESDPAEEYGSEIECPDRVISLSVRLFKDGEAQVGIANMVHGTTVYIDATAVPIPDDGIVLTFDQSSDQLGFADGEAIMVLDRRPDGSALLSWERWAPSCVPTTA